MVLMCVLETFAYPFMHKRIFTSGGYECVLVSFGIVFNVLIDYKYSL